MRTVGIFKGTRSEPNASVGDIFFHTSIEADRDNKGGATEGINEERCLRRVTGIKARGSKSGARWAILMLWTEDVEGMKPGVEPKAGGNNDALTSKTCDISPKMGTNEELSRENGDEDARF